MPHTTAACVIDSQEPRPNELTPSFRGMTLIKRLTLFIRGGVIEHVIYPVFPPDQSAESALQWLEGAAPSN